MSPTSSITIISYGLLWHLYVSRSTASWSIFLCNLMHNRQINFRNICCVDNINILKFIGILFFNFLRVICYIGRGEIYAPHWKQCVPRRVWLNSWAVSRPKTAGNETHKVCIIVRVGSWGKIGFLSSPFSPIYRAPPATSALVHLLALSVTGVGRRRDVVSDISPHIVSHSLR